MIDPQIPLEVKPLNIPSPLDEAGKALAVKNAMQQGQMGGLELQQRQIQLDQTKAINKAYTDALTVDPVTGKASVDTNGLTKALALNGHGSAIPGILSSVTKSQKAISDLRESQLKVTNLEQDAAGAVGNATLAANGDPHLFLTQLTHAVQAGAMKQEQAAPIIEHMQGLLATDAQDTTGASQTARDFASQTARQLVASSEKYQALATSAKSAEGSYMRGQAAQDNAERQAATAEMVAEEKARTDAGKTRSDAFAQARSIATSGDAQAYKQFVDAQPAVIQGELYHVADPRKFDTTKTSQALDQAMLSPKDRETARATAARVAQAEADRQTAITQRNRALGIQQQNADRDRSHTDRDIARDQAGGRHDLLKAHIQEAGITAQMRRASDAIQAAGKEGDSATVHDKYGQEVNAKEQLNALRQELSEVVADKYEAYGRTGRPAPSVSYDQAVQAIRDGKIPDTPKPETAANPAPAPEPTLKPAAQKAAAPTFKYTEAQIRARAKAENIDPDTLVKQARDKKLIP